MVSTANLHPYIVERLYTPDVAGPGRRGFARGAVKSRSLNPKPRLQASFSVAGKASPAQHTAGANLGEPTSYAIPNFHSKKGFNFAQGWT